MTALYIITYSINKIWNNFILKTELSSVIYLNDVYRGRKIICTEELICRYQHENINLLNWRMQMLFTVCKGKKICYVQENDEGDNAKILYKDAAYYGAFVRSEQSCAAR